MTWSPYHGLVVGTHIVRISVLCQIYGCIYFLPMCELPRHFPNDFFQRADVFKSSQFFLLWFVNGVFAYTICKTFFHVSSKCLIVSQFTWISVVYCNLVFAWGVRWASRSHSFPNFNIVPGPFVEKTVLFPFSRLLKIISVGFFLIHLCCSMDLDVYVHIFISPSFWKVFFIGVEYGVERVFLSAFRYDNSLGLHDFWQGAPIIF